jgi:hypothetical protein
MSLKFPPTKQESPTEQIVKEINQVGLEEYAQRFRVSKRTLRRWLKAQNYFPKRIFVKQEKQAS